MKKSSKKFFASFIAGVLLASSVVSISANATNWALYNTLSAPSSASKYSDLAGFFTSSRRTSLQEQCTYYYTGGTHDDGSVVYVKYKPYAVDSQGNKINICSSWRYHYGTSSVNTITLDSPVPANSTIYGNYFLMNYNGISCSIRGTIS